MLLTVDRIEGDKVVCQDDNRKVYALDRALFPAALREGDRVSFSPNEGAQILPEQTKARRDALSKRFSRLFKKQER